MADPLEFSAEAIKQEEPGPSPSTQKAFEKRDVKEQINVQDIAQTHGCSGIRQGKGRYYWFRHG